MFIRRNKSISHARIGDLFAEAKIVSRDVVEQSHSISKIARLPLGRVLEMSGHLNDKSLSGALQVQQMVANRQLSREQGVELLKLMHTSGLSVDEALAIKSWQYADNTNYSPVGKLLLGAGIVSEEQLGSVARDTQHNDLPLGRGLILAGVLNEEQLINVLNTLILLRDGKISNSDAVILTKKFVSCSLTFWNALQIFGFQQGMDSERMRLGELLVKAGLLDHANALDAVELAIENNVRLGDLLVSVNVITPRALDNALRLQRLLSDGELTSARAVDLLTLSNNLDANLDDVMAELELLRQVVQFLRSAKLITEQQIRDVRVDDAEHPSDTARALLARGHVDPDLVIKAKACLRFVQSGQINQDEAIGLLNYSLAGNLEPHQALHDFKRFERHNSGEHNILQSRDLIDSIA